MARTALREVRDSKYTGTFTRQQVDRAIRQVERGQGGRFVEKERGGSASTPSRGGSSPKH